MVALLKAMDLILFQLYVTEIATNLTYRHLAVE